MREINLNGKQYKITGDIVKRAINPWIASITSGTREYSSFQTAQLKEYHDLRNGIGLESDLTTESSRTWFTEGVDFTTPRSAVLGPLVTTAGSFGVAPVKIIDFQGKTYAIGHNQISEWSGSAWTSRDTSLASPLDAIVITDDTDEYLIVSSATLVIYSTDGTTWSTLDAFGDSPDFTTYTEVDGTGKLTVTATKITSDGSATGTDNFVYIDKTTDALDRLDVDSTIRIESTSSDNAVGGMAISNTVGSYDDFASTDISVLIKRTAGPVYKIHLVRGNFTADDSYTGSADTPYYCTLKRFAGNDTVTLEIYSDSARTTLLDTLSVSGYSTTKYRYVYGFVGEGNGAGAEDFDGYVENLSLNNTVGYMANFENRLYMISTDGKNIHLSASKDIDTYSDGFTLTGNFGTVYDFFEGKLLADGTPVLYFCGTEGLYTLDTTNEIAYRQEVNYPPLTNAGHVGIYWNGSVWVGTGFGILKVTPSLATFVGPDQDDGLPATYQGSIFDMVTVNNWLVYCVNGGPHEYIPLTNSNFEDGDPPDDWTLVGGGATVSRSSTQAKTGTYSALLTRVGTNCHIYQSYPGYADYANKTVTLGCWVYATVAARVGIGLGDGTGSASSTLHTGVAGWEWLTASLAVDASPSYLRSYLEIIDGNTAAYFDGAELTVDSVSNKSSILKRNSSLGGNLQVYTTTAVDTPIACLHHSPSSLYTNGRLWFGEDTDVKYMMFPDTTSNVKQISTYDYVNDSGGSPYSRFPIFRKLAAITKVALGVAAITKSCDANEFIEVFYGLNGAAPTTSLGTFKTSPRPTLLTFGSGLGIEFYTIQFSIKLFRGATVTNSPELESLLFYYMPRPETINAFDFRIEATTENADKIITEIEAIRDTKVLVPFYDTGDPAKTVYNVALTSMPLKYRVENRQTRRGTIAITLEEVFSG